MLFHPVKASLRVVQFHSKNTGCTVVCNQRLIAVLCTNFSKILYGVKVGDLDLTLLSMCTLLRNSYWFQ